MFVKATSGDLADWGIGKLLSRMGAACIVEYFDTPVSEPVLKECLSSELGSVSIPAQTRVYAFDNTVGAWEIGRVLDDHGDSQLIKFPNGKTLHLPIANVFVRWDRPIEDPTTFLGAGLSETPRFADGRSPFVRTLLQQRSASLGMSALLSSAIELEAHQVEVVRRVLQDPIQRYLLADEVGLGKTIEAGILIRQCVLDDPGSAVIVVLVPDALVSQWRSELTVKFFLGGLLDRTVFVEPFSHQRRGAGLLAKATMLVVDEAHYITMETPESERLYAVINAAAHKIERVLLLSATPALHNERGFLRMLHLLDPTRYPLDGEEAFRRRIESRQALAEIVATLAPENSLYLDHTLDQLAELFPDDPRLNQDVGRLRGLLTAMPAEDDPELIKAIANIRDHLSEVYRLHRRILRHRRRSVGGLTPDRAGLEIIRYGSVATSKAVDLNEDWRLSVAATSGAPHRQAELAAFDLAERRLEYRRQQRSEPHSVGAWENPDGTRLRSATEDALSNPERLNDRIAALVTAIATRRAPRVQFLVFCSDPEIADSLTAKLASGLGIEIDRHDPYNEAWQAFNDDLDRQVLVCDRRAEEGLNLQGGEKIVVHFDLPLNPNRVEQRLGRADRYGSGRAVRSLCLCCNDDPLEGAWSHYLDEGLKVFGRSVASLQYLIEQTVSALPRLLLEEGAEGIEDLLKQDGGEAGRIEREIKNIDDQDALDALGTPPAEALDALSDVDDQWREIDVAVDGWVRTTLQFDRTEDIISRGANSASPMVGGLFRYKYLTGDRHTLIPLDTFVQSCRPAIDVNRRVPGSRDVWTTPFSYRRPTVLSRQGRSLGARVLRYGDPFLAGLQEITQRDERGRSTGVWRHCVGAPTSVEGVHFRFDFIVEADTRGAARVLALADQLTSTARSSLSRRSDMALAPFFHTVWLDSDFEEIFDPGLLAALSKPYAIEANDQGGRDFNLNPRRWGILRKMNLPYLEEWPEVCRRARERAEACLRALPGLNQRLEQAARRAEAADGMRLGLLKARSLCTDATDLADLDLERDLSRELIAGIRAPRVSLDAVTASFIGESQTIAAALARA